ncbi:glycosyl transferase family 2 [Niabella ginsenosidivorans]|uniref:Glycosyl transferase family 2 n=1 Tax=Niabella ginsenosidivorans TaxID=1176587 RepID=A0A1A9I5R9_9BACT|nr:glycosyltransferase family 2 protein [Niabella ginsenosidivorans]ANH82032.1 glycosyl transferase family 2 [Niabella ginsenosidivorans]
MISKPLVSVIMPTYNRATKILNAINSALGQTYTNIEILVVDDGSADATREVLKDVQGIRYIRQEHGGQARARNTGLALAKGEIIASLDSDDIWYPSFLERCVDKLTADNLDFVFANWDQETGEGATADFLTQHIYIQPYFHKMKDGWVNLTNDEIRKVYLQGCPSPSSALIIRRSIMGSGWNPEIKIGDDWYLYLNVILSGKRTAAFTLDRLWRKCIDQKNIYDGRKRSEVLENLYIADLHKMITAFKDRLTPEELKFLQNKHVYSLVELAKHNLIREFNLVETGKLLGRSFSIDAAHAFKSIPEVISFGLKRKLGIYRTKRDGRSKAN